MEVQEVEVANLERTVVRAIPGADAAVVHHVVQPLGTVRGRRHRANVFARSVFALHARQRLLYRARLVFRCRRSSDPCASSAFRVRAALDLFPRPEYYSRPGKPRRKHCNRCRRSDRSPCPTDCPYRRSIPDRSSAATGTSFISSNHLRATSCIPRQLASRTTGRSSC